MASPRTSTHSGLPRAKSRGFTLIEILIVMGMLAIVGGFGLVVSLDSLRGYTFRSGRDLAVSSLERARAQAINNICLGTCTGGKPHGVRLVSVGGKLTQVIIFQVTSGSGFNPSDTNNATINVANGVTGAIQFQPTTDIIFTQLSGTSTATSAGFSEGSSGAPIASSTITVGAEGDIRWTN